MMAGKTIRQRFSAFCYSTRASAVEFTLIFPILFFVMIGLIDAGNLFAQHRKAQQVAESLVRSARVLDLAIANSSIMPLSDDNITLLRNIAGRMWTQAPQGVNYIWIGRFVRPQSGTDPLQLLPNGLSSGNNLGIVLVGNANYAAQANTDVLAEMSASMNANDIVYVVDVTFSHMLMSPVPASLRRSSYSVRYSL